MNRKISIYASQALATALATYGGRINRSWLISTLLARYGDLVAAELDYCEFSNSEWRAILAVNGRVTTPTMVWANVHDAPGLGATFGIDQALLVKRLQRCQRGQLLAIAEAAERFHTWPDLSTDEAMAKAGIKPR